MSTQQPDQAQQSHPEPTEDPTGRGTLGQFAKRGAEGVQVLAEKVTGDTGKRYRRQQPEMPKFTAHA